jgi:hypothetical protein
VVEEISLRRRVTGYDPMLGVDRSCIHVLTSNSRHAS